MVVQPAVSLDPVEALAPEGGPDAPAPVVPEEAADLVEALTMAWTTFTLYENPTSIEAFDRALETLHRVAPAHLLIEILPDGFLYRGTAIHNRREAAQRLARQLFAHGTAAVEVTAPPTAEDLLATLAVIADTPGEHDPNDLLRDRGVTAITLLRRELLAERKGYSDEGVTVEGGEASPGSFAHQLLLDHGDDRDGLSQQFVSEYRRVYDLLDPTDHWGREEVVHAFVDAFFHLPRHHQGAVLNLMVISQDREESLLFVDQLGSTELGELARHLSPETQSLLIDYARLAAEHAESQHHAELLRLIAEAGGSGITETVSGRLSAALRSPSPETSTREAVARLRARRLDPSQHLRSGINVMRGLLALGVEGAPPTGLAVTWASKVAEAVRAGRLEEADAWLGAIGGLKLPDEHRRSLLSALAAAVDRAALRGILATFGRPEDEPGSVVRRAAPLFITDALIAQIAVETSEKDRDRLLGVLAGVAKARPGPVAAHLNETRPWVLRAVIAALAQSGHAGAALRIEPLLGHPEPRVRAAALAALARLTPEECTTALLRALQDPAEEVRLQAASLLAENQDHRIDSALIVRLQESRDRGERLAVIAALGRRTTPAARETLTSLASRRSISPTARALRQAARRALRGAT